MLEHYRHGHFVPNGPPVEPATIHLNVPLMAETGYEILDKDLKPLAWYDDIIAAQQSMRKEWPHGAVVVRCCDRCLVACRANWRRPT